MSLVDRYPQQSRVWVWIAGARRVFTDAVKRTFSVKLSVSRCLVACPLKRDDAVGATSWRYRRCNHGNDANNRLPVGDNSRKAIRPKQKMYEISQ